jgi:putative exosortase-associated protein (TIGR04073 family)
MKAKMLCLLFAACFAASSIALADTEDAPVGHNPLRKLGRGFANLLFGIVELPNQITKATSDHGGAAGFTYGLGKGFTRWIAREGVGVYEVVTFPVPCPKGYKPIITPEFPNEDFEP